MSRPVSRFPVFSLLAAAALVASGLAARHLLTARAEQLRDTPAPSGGRVVRPTPDQELLLARAERQIIWAVEDRAFQLGKKVLADWDRAVRESDATPLIGACAAGFRGRVLDGELRTVRGDFCAYGQLDAASAAERDCEASEFVAALIELRREFDPLETAHWSVKSLRPVEQDSLAATEWHCLLQLELRGCVAGGPAETVVQWQVTSGALPKDLSGLEHWMLYAEVRSVRSVCGTGGDDRARSLMADVTDRCGFDASLFHDNWTTGIYEQVTGGVYVADYDRDGWLDFLVTDVRRFGLFRGTGGGRFAEVTQQAGLPTELGPKPIFALWADLDNDGYEDLILGTRLYRNRGDGGFDDVTEQSGLRLPPEVNNISVADYDGDGLVDLYACISRPVPGDEGRRSWLDVHDGQPNRLWRNLGELRFADVTDECGVANRGRSFAAVWFRYNNDRFPDLYVINEVGQNTLYVNSGTGRFAAIDIDGDRFGGFSMGVDVGDVNNDGAPDLYVANMYSKAGNRIIENLTPASYPPGIYDKVRDFCTGNRLYLAQASGGFHEVAPAARVAEVGWAYGVRMVDLDNDGWLDLYAACGQQSVNRDDPDG